MSQQNIDDLLRTHPHLKDFVPFLGHFNKESDRGAALIAAGFLEQQLSNVLAAYFVEGEVAKMLLDGTNAPLGAFSARIDCCFSLGLISASERSDLHIIRRVRNDFAHRVNVSFESASVRDRCALLHSKAHDYTTLSREEIRVPASGQFKSAAVSLILSLVNRPFYVAQRRCTSQQWPS